MIRYRPASLEDRFRKIHSNFLIPVSNHLSSDLRELIDQKQSETTPEYPDLGYIVVWNCEMLENDNLRRKIQRVAFDGFAPGRTREGSLQRFPGLVAGLKGVNGEVR